MNNYETSFTFGNSFSEAIVFKYKWQRRSAIVLRICLNSGRPCLQPTAESRKGLMVEKIFETGNDVFPIAIGRQYDARLGRRWNVDPMFNKYLSESPYLVFCGNPIYFTDVRGNDPPEGFVSYEGVNGNVIIPANSEITYDESGKISTFKIGEKIYGASYNGNRDFVGYFYKGGIEIEQYNNPDIDIYGKGLWKGRSENKILMRMEEYFEENVKIFIELTGCTVDQINIIQVVQLSDLAPDVLKTSRWENWVINSESFVGCVDGAKNSWDAKGNPTKKESNRGTPYYYPDIDVESRPGFSGFISKPINDSQKASEWDFNSQSGYIITYDHAGIQQFAKKCYFEVLVIGINFNGTWENIILGKFQWGWNYMGRSGNEIGATGEKTILMNPPVFDKTFDILNYEYPEFKLIY